MGGDRLEKEESDLSMWARRVIVKFVFIIFVVEESEEVDFLVWAVRRLLRLG